MSEAEEMLPAVNTAIEAFKLVIRRLRAAGFSDQVIEIACLLQAYLLFTENYGHREGAQEQFKAMMEEVFAQDPRPRDTVQ